MRVDAHIDISYTFLKVRTVGPYIALEVSLLIDPSALLPMQLWIHLIKDKTSLFPHFLQKGHTIS